MIGELELDQITPSAFTLVSETVSNWWGIFGGSLEPEESLGEMVIQELENAFEDLKRFS